MKPKDFLKQKFEELDQKVKAKLAVHDMEPKLKKMYQIRERFRKIGNSIDERIDLIERMKKKADNEKPEKE